MDYYIVVNGQKEGPVDILSFIKKVKNGSITAATQVSTAEAGPFRPAGEVEELKSIIKSQTGYRAAQGEDIDFNVNVIFNEGTDNWIRKVTEYTIFFGAIMIISAIIPSLLKNIQFFADYVYVTNYVTAAIAYTLLSFFFYYVLMTKRSQDPNPKELLAVVKFSFPHLLIFSSLMALLVLPLGINIILSMVTYSVIVIALSVTVFVPFLVTDHHMNLRRAIMVSLESFKAMKARVVIVIFCMLAVNIGAVVLPSLLHSQIILLGLVVVVPISVSILAQIYDHILA